MKLRKEDIFPAPPVERAVPPSEERLRELIASDGPSAHLYLSLGNVLIREERYADAAEAYAAGLGLEGFQPELRTNLGVAAFFSDDFEQALSHFRQAILLNTQLALPHFHSGRAQIEMKYFDAAETSFEKALKLQPNWSEAALHLAELAERRGDQDEALLRYQHALELDPEIGRARIRIAAAELERGKARFLKGDLEQAFEIWAGADKQFAPAFSVEQEIVTELQTLARNYEKSGDLARLKAELLPAWSDAEKRAELFYVLTARMLFSVGLVPECFESRANLEAELTRWQASLALLGEHPYPHFRIGLIHIYRGEIEDAESEIRHCQDKLLPKKQSALKLQRLLEFIGELKDIERQGREGLLVHSPDFEWEAEGFDNPFERNGWKQAGFLPADARKWRDAGFSSVKAKPWFKEKIPVEDAALWSQAEGVEPKQAKRWSRAKFTPEEASLWGKFFKENVEQAVQCRQVGFADPELAFAWLQVVLFPWDAIRWHELGFTPEDASRFIADGIKDPHQAKEREKW